MLPRRPSALDPDFDRIARRLEVFELMSDDDESLHALDDVSMKPGQLEGRAHTAFLDFYSKDGLRYGLEAYGLHDKLVALGLGDYQLEVTREDAFHHRLELFLGDARDDEHRIMDLRVHLKQMAAPRTDDEDPAAPAPRYPVMVIDWLSMQNPLGRFTRERPRLPGQRFPGTGLGRAMHNILIIMAERVKREALVNVPEHFHLAVLYARGRYRYASLARAAELRAVLDATDELGSFAKAAWAVERGFVVEETEAGPLVYRYRPSELILPLSARVEEELPGLLARVAHRVAHRERRFVVDVEGLERSLAEDPVEGLER